MNLPKHIINVDEGHGDDFTVFMVIKLEPNKKSTLIDSNVVEVVSEDFRNVSADVKAALISGKLFLLEQKYKKGDGENL